MDGGYYGYPWISTDLVDMDGIVGELDVGLVDMDWIWIIVTRML